MVEFLFIFFGLQFVLCIIVHESKLSFVFVIILFILIFYIYFILRKLPPRGYCFFLRIIYYQVIYYYYYFFFTIKIVLIVKIPKLYSMPPVRHYDCIIDLMD